MQGAGPDEEALRAAWTDRRDMRWFGQRDKADVLRLYEDHDVLVMPSRDEGLPVALLEAGAAGVVPVVSDLAERHSRRRDARRLGLSSRCRRHRRICRRDRALDRDRARVEEMSGAVRHAVATRFDADQRTAGYQQLFARWQELKRPRPVNPRLAYGSRLDQPWMPNAAVRMIRSALGRR